MKPNTPKPTKYLGPAGRKLANLQAAIRATKLEEKNEAAAVKKLALKCEKSVVTKHKKMKAIVTYGIALGDRRQQMLVKTTGRKRIPRRTPQRAAQERRYRARVKVWLAQYHFCEWEGCTNKPTEVHHRNGRRGRLLLWEAGWFALCQHHHQDVHANPAEARRRGLLCPAGQWNDQRIAQ